MKKTSHESFESRTPRQARGRARREAILDASAAIVAEKGLEGVTMQAVAGRAEASIGSMYHFFRHREQLLHALAQHHSDALQAIVQECAGIGEHEWRAMPAATVIEKLFGVPLSYFAKHPDALITLRLQDRNGVDSYQVLLERVMRARLRSAQKGAKAAQTFYAVVAGSIVFARDHSAIDAKNVMATIPHVLLAYLHALE